MKHIAFIVVTCIQIPFMGCELDNNPLSHVNEYGVDEDIVGVRRDFPWNWDVVLTENKELNAVLKELTK